MKESLVGARGNKVTNIEFSMNFKLSENGRICELHEFTLPLTDESGLYAAANKPIWELNSLGVLSVKSFYDLLSNGEVKG